MRRKYQGMPESSFTISQIPAHTPQFDTIIAQKLFTQFKKTHSTHKLGILFLVDSITRQWIEKARNAGQELSGSSAPDGTYASGVFKMTELLPSLIDELLRVAPADQKVCCKRVTPAAKLLYTLDLVESTCIDICAAHTLALWTCTLMLKFLT